MDNLEDVRNVELIAGTTIGDIFTFDFFVYAVGQVVLASAILIIGFFVAGFLKRRIVALAERSEYFDRTLGRFLASLARYTVLAITIIFVLQQFGLQTTSLVALLGAAGLARRGLRERAFLVGSAAVGLVILSVAWVGPLGSPLAEEAEFWLAMTYHKLEDAQLSLDYFHRAEAKFDAYWLKFSRSDIPGSDGDPQYYT